MFCGCGKKLLLTGFHRLHCRIEPAGRFLQTGGVKPGKFILLLLTVAFGAGCQKSAAPEPSRDDQLPKQAQPRLRTMKIYLGAETLDAELALTREQEMTGMMFRTNILETKDGWFARHNINPGTVIRTDKGSLAETFFRN